MATWRAGNINGVPVLLCYRPCRVYCSKHGVHTEYIPWADGPESRSRFTPDFNNEVSFLALTCPKTVVSEYMGINWDTVGNCIKATHGRLEPDVTERLKGLRRICVDETSYHRGYKYITVVYDLDRNQVCWVHLGYGEKVFKTFCEDLQKIDGCKKIEIVAGDGARWIDSCTREYFPKAKRCVDFFHVVGWVNDTLDKIRLNAQADASREVKRLTDNYRAAEAEQSEQLRQVKAAIKEVQKKLDQLPRRGRPGRAKRELLAYLHSLEEQCCELENPTYDPITEEEYLAAKAELDTLPRRGRHSARQKELLRTISLYEAQVSSGSGKLSDIHQKEIDTLRQKVRDIKGSRYALGKNPENLTQAQQDKLSVIQESYPDVYKAYQCKETIRAITHMQTAELAEVELDKWIESTLQSDCGYLAELAKKIQRHRENILNAIRYHANSSRSEAANTTIKALIATARGFRNTDNMIALIYLRCSDLVIPLNNRIQPTPEELKSLRELQNERRRKRAEAKQSKA
jgi:transposase